MFGERDRGPVEDSLKKIISQTGITTIEGYRGAKLFEAVGFGPELMEFLGDCPSRIGGVGLAEMVEDAQWRLGQAEKMTVLGRNREYHAFNAKVRMALRKAATAAEASRSVSDQRMKKAARTPTPASSPRTSKRSKRPENPDDTPPLGVLSKEYLDFSNLVNARTPTVLRDLFAIKKRREPVR